MPRKIGHQEIGAYDLYALVASAQTIRELLR
jgi:hypothetical protein